ncbi:MAG: TonB-dependent receptor [Gammaproteobacteria bacterium]|nr:TonB-dependent receptor [Gammaproteobacteria bacterium]
MISQFKTKTALATSLLVFFGLFATLAAQDAAAGSLAPAPRVIAKYERNFLERTGAMTLEEVLDTGIIRYFLTGGLPVLVLVNGRPYATTSNDLDPIPVSAIERLEVLSGDTLGTFGGSAVRGALNVVLRQDLDGFEVNTSVRRPSRDGGEGQQGSVFWGSAVGEGRMTLGMDVIKRNEIPSDSREYSRSAWEQGGTFRDARNVSIGGNTVWVVQRDGQGGPVTGLRTMALGECDPGKGYTGELSNPSGSIVPGDKGCGFAYGKFAWNTSSYEQQGVLLNLNHPVGEEAEFHLEANVTQAESAFRYAPSVGVFSFTPDGGLLRTIDDQVPADDNDDFVVGHRFIGHGNRDWLTDTEEFDLSMGIEGLIQEDLGYDVEISAYELDGSLTGNTFVHGEKVQTAIAEGRYDLEDPSSTGEVHRNAIAETSLEEDNDFGSEHLSTRLALEGTRPFFGDRKASWTAGLELGRLKVHDVTVYRDNEGETYPVSEVLGSGGVSYAGEREFAGAFAEVLLPVTEKLEFRVAGRGDDLDDVGGLESWRLSSYYAANDLVTLRSSWSTGERTPSMSALYSDETQDHPYIDCDPGSGDPPRTCAQSNPRQVTRETSGNPALEPSGNERITVGGRFSKRPFFFDLEWQKTSRSDLPGQHSANWAMQNLPECDDTATAKTDCIDRTGSDITIHTGFANVVDTELEGVHTRFGSGFRTGWGTVGFRGTWRHISSSELSVAGVKRRYAIPRDAFRLGVAAKRGSLSVSWIGNYRAGFRNRSGTGSFKSWTGHDLSVDWEKPWGLENARFTTGVLNLTDTQLSVDTSNPSSVDGPTAAGWGRTFFLKFNLRF